MYIFDNFKYDIYMCVLFTFLHGPLKSLFFRYRGSHIIKANGGFIQKKKYIPRVIFQVFGKTQKEGKWFGSYFQMFSIFKCKVTIIKVARICIEPGENANFKLSV